MYRYVQLLTAFSNAVLVGGLVKRFGYKINPYFPLTHLDSSLPKCSLMEEGREGERGGNPSSP
jgi:hypothetical protein